MRIKHESSYYAELSQELKRISLNKIKRCYIKNEGKNLTDLKEIQKPDFIFNQEIEEIAKSKYLKYDPNYNEEESKNKPNKVKLEDYNYKVKWYDSNMYDWSKVSLLKLGNKFIVLLNLTINKVKWRRL